MQAVLSLTMMKNWHRRLEAWERLESGRAFRDIQAMTTAVYMPFNCNGVLAARTRWWCCWRTWSSDLDAAAWRRVLVGGKFAHSYPCFKAHVSHHGPNFVHSLECCVVDTFADVYYWEIVNEPAGEQDGRGQEVERQEMISADGGLAKAL